jgi:hypothetical protein
MELVASIHRIAITKKWPVIHGVVGEFLRIKHAESKFRTQNFQNTKKQRTIFQI